MKIKFNKEENDWELINERGSVIDWGGLEDLVEEYPDAEVQLPEGLS